MEQFSNRESVTSISELSEIERVEADKLATTIVVEMIEQGHREVQGGSIMVVLESGKVVTVPFSFSLGKSTNEWSTG